MGSGEGTSGRLIQPASGVQYRALTVRVVVEAIVGLGLRNYAHVT